MPPDSAPLLALGGTAAPMDSERTAATVGAGACLLTAGAVAAPYVLLPEGAVQYVGRYYAAGPVNPLAIGLLGLVGAIVFAAGREGRSDPDLVAGIMLSVGVFSVAVAAAWAAGFDPNAVGAGSKEALTFMDTHRWSVLAGGVLEAVAGVWYAVARRLVPLPGVGGGR